MENKELLTAIAQMLEEQEQRLKADIDAKLDKRFAEQDTKLDKRFAEQDAKIEQQTKKLTIFIENNVTKRIDVLFDGYTQNHDKQIELERQNVVVQKQIQDLQVRVGVLELKNG